MLNTGFMYSLKLHPVCLSDEIVNTILDTIRTIYVLSKAENSSADLRFITLYKAEVIQVQKSRNTPKGLAIPSELEDIVIIITPMIGRKQ